MTTTRTCIDCGGALPPQRTRPALRCADCNRTKRHIKVRPERICLDCGVGFQPPVKNGPPQQRCEPCREERKRLTDSDKSRRWRESNTEAYRASSIRGREKRKAQPGYREYRNEAHMKSKYGITRAEFDALLGQQGGTCAICKGGPNGPGTRLHVDHCHKSMKVRGLLCSNCNRALGMFGDDPARLRAAADYLEKDEPHG